MQSWSVTAGTREPGQTAINLQWVYSIAHRRGQLAMRGFSVAMDTVKNIRVKQRLSVAHISCKLRLRMP